MERSPESSRLESISVEGKAALRGVTTLWETGLRLEPLESFFRREAGGFLDESEFLDVFRNESRGTNCLKIRQLIDILCTKSNDDFDRFRKILEDRKCEHQAQQLKDKVSLNCGILVSNC